VFALRKQLYTLLDEPGMRDILRTRIQSVLKIHSINPADTIRYLIQDKLIALIEACPEISAADIDRLYEEYRYGQNPTLYIFLFNPRRVKRPSRLEMQAEIRQEIEAWNAQPASEQPSVHRLALDSLLDLPDQPELLEGSYRFLRRIDYIDAEQNPTSAYETLYGFFWLHLKAGYCVIHGREPHILHALEIAIERGAGLNLVSLVFTRELKNSLPFLLEESLRSSRLHDPNPDSGRFRWMTIVDDAPYAKGYRELEASYPEVRDARYRVEIDEQRDTSLNIYFDRGALSLAGKLSATQFRNWALLSLGEIIAKVQSLHTKPAMFIQTQGFRNVPELARYSAAQKVNLLRLTADILELKIQPGIGYRATGISPLALANQMQRLLRVTLYLTCPQEGCGREGYFACEVCGGTDFHVVKREAGFALKCPRHKSQPWSVIPPFHTTCLIGHLQEIDDNTLEEGLQLLPSTQLLNSMADLVEKYIPSYTFDPEKEGFYIRGRRVYYTSEPAKPELLQPLTIFNNIQVGKVEAGGTVTGVALDGATSARIQN
jgi:hypothetical protein